MICTALLAGSIDASDKFIGISVDFLYVVGAAEFMMNLHVKGPIRCESAGH
jgi:hypothetical protein